MKNLRETDENVFLIKIPKSYFPDRQHRNGNWDVPIPIFYEQQGTDEYGREGVYPILIPNLIQGCYNKKKGFITSDRNLSSNKISYDDKRLESQKNIWQILKRRTMGITSIS